MTPENDDNIEQEKTLEKLSNLFGCRNIVQDRVYGLLRIIPCYSRLDIG